MDFQQNILLHEGVDCDPHLKLKELVLQSHLPGVGVGSLETLFVFTFTYLQGITITVIPSLLSTVKLLPVVLGQFHVEAVDGDDERLVRACQHQGETHENVVADLDQAAFCPPS